MDNDLDQVLRGEMESPSHTKPLERIDVRGIVTDPGGGNVVRIGLELQGGLIVRSSFRAFGDPKLFACCSFLLDLITEQSLRFAANVQEDALAYSLRLPLSSAWCAGLAVEALAAALGAATDRLRRQRSTGRRRGPPPGIHAATARSRITRTDRAMLRPGESLDELLEERNLVMGMLHHLDGLAEVGQSAHGLQLDSASDERELLLALRACLTLALSRLRARDKVLIILVELEGLTLEEAGGLLDMSKQAASKRLAAVVRKVHAAWRRPGKKKLEAGQKVVD